MSSRTHKIIGIPGDGIGVDVTIATVEVMDAVQKKYDFKLDWNIVDWGSDYFRKNSRMMPVDALETMAKSDAIYLGAVGSPDIPDHETLWGLLIPIRRNFDQYINLRPIRSFPGVEGPLKSKSPIDILIVRENSEGEYSKIGGRYGEGTEFETALQVSIFSRHGIRRVAEYARDQALLRKKNVVSATKSNGIIHSMPFWDDVVSEVFTTHPEIKYRSFLIDALAATMVLDPGRFDVIVASNLFGDILSDLAAALVGSIGIAASGNINPEGRYPSMFEPVHGSAPDIAGKGIANPVGGIQAATMMLAHLKESEAADEIEFAIQSLLAEGHSTPDLGGTDNTDSFTKRLVSRINQ
jgi:tartrate dehydrogenase/decarboxylase/D-malate dehydrogenase